jgi:transposase
VDRRKRGCKRHAVGDARGTPLLTTVTPADVRDERPLAGMLDALPAVRQPRGRPRRKPAALLGDRGYGYAWVIASVVARGIASLLSPRGTPHGSGLGARRYVIERTMAWFGHFRRLKLCYEREGRHFQAFHDLASCMICFNKLADGP